MYVHIFVTDARVYRVWAETRMCGREVVMAWHCGAVSGMVKRRAVACV